MARSRTLYGRQAAPRARALARSLRSRRVRPLTLDAKNTTTQANLSYHERAKLKAAGRARRLGTESFKPLDACNLCLSKADDAVACPSAHVFCRACALADLIAQKAGIEAQRAQIAQWEDEDARRRADAREKAKERVVADFERRMGLAPGSAKTSSSGASSSSRPASASTSTTTSAAGKAGFALDADAIEAAAAAAESRATAEIDAEATDARRAKIAAFWLPANTPSAPLGPLKAVKLQTLCHMGNDGAHPVARKTLLPVVFTYPPASKDDVKPSCPSCQKELSNATGAVLLTSREPAGVDAKKADTDGADGAAGGDGPRKKKKKDKTDSPPVCGHVVCSRCADAVVKPSQRCCVCEARVPPENMLPLGREGTGYAAAGGAEAKQNVVVFRV